MSFIGGFFNFLLVILVANVTAIPIAEEPRGLTKLGAVLNTQLASESEDMYRTMDARRFVLENNLWGESTATSGSQISQAISVDENDVSWYTAYNWVGGNFKVKSYANLDLRIGLGKAISAIGSIPTSWSWMYTSASSDLVANISYDLWLSNNPNSTGASSSSTFEVMVWLSARGGAYPAGSQIGTASVNGVTWKLFKGTVSTWTVLTFLAPNEITQFNSDLSRFLNFLTVNHSVPPSQYLVQAQAGTEVFIGNANLTTNSYSISIN